MQKTTPALINIEPHHPLHLKWKSVIYRCYNESQLKRRPTYREVHVCESWFDFSNFCNWYYLQPYGEHIDKDLKILGSKLYSPSTCLLVDQEVNSFLIGLFLPRGVYPRGVCTNKHRPGIKVWRGQINLGNGSVALPWRVSQIEAHADWQVAKAARAQELSEKQTNTQVSSALDALSARLLEDRREGRESIFN